MKRPLQLSLAIALALGGTNALALGLGPVHVKSKLNQPLEAEIPIIQGTAGEAEGLLVNLAAAEDFERVGISRSHLSVPLEFKLGKGANGESVIKVTSKDPIHDTYLDFLLEANWPKGRLLREYTVLLDPPVMAPARGAATTSAVAAAPAPVTVKRREAPATASTEAPKPAAAPPRPKPTPAPAPAPSMQPPEHKVVAGQYGPVAEGETLSGVARATRVSGVNSDQMMLALLKSNPNAFYKDNVNALKRGAILRVPSADEVKAIGSATEAAAQVRSQIEDWRGGRATPTRVADASGTTPATSVPATTPKTPKATAGNGKVAADEHLALVPPKAGKDSMAMADRPGSGAGSAATSELKSELARTKETLTTREQEAGDLKSRVKELEGLKDKNDRLIGLKDSEIAELQQKLKQLQDKSSASTTKPASTSTSMAATAPAPTTSAAPATPSSPAATGTPAKSTGVPPPPPAAVPSTTATAKIDKQDIWGDSGTAPSPAKSDADKTPPPPTTAASTPMASATAPASTSGSALTSSPATSSSSSAAPTPATSSTTSSTPPVSTTTPLESSPATTATPVSPSTPTPVAVTSTPKPTPKVGPTRAATNEWYEASWVKPAALGAGVLLLLGGLLGMRKRNAAPVASVARGSVADSFGDSPLTGSGGSSSGTIEAEEESLREQLQLDPSNTGLHLELLSLYYAERDVERFEDAAADMHAYVEDAHQPEWLEAQAMGQELAPHNPLFGSAAHLDGGDAAIASAQADTFERPHLHDHQDFDTAPSRLPSAVAHHDDEDFGFNLGRDDFAATPVAPAHPAASDDDSFDFTLPPLDMDPPVVHVPPAAVAAPKMAELEDDYFAGDDAIGTKLDLAKAYMDMGDPDGARSMLEEVVAEGSEAQKAEAHRLISEIR